MTLKKVFLFFIIIISSSCGLLFAEDDLPEYNSTKVEEILNKFIKASPNEREKELVNFFKILQVVVQKDTFDNSRRIISNADEIIFSPYKDKEITISQLTFLLAYTPRKERWLFKRNYFEAKSFEKDRVIYLNDPSLMLANHWTNARDYLDQGKFELFDKEIKLAKSIPCGAITKELCRTFLLISSTMQFKSHIYRGNLDLVINMYPHLDTEINWFLDDFISQKENFAMRYVSNSFSIIGEIDLIIGNFQHAIDLGHKIIKITGGDLLNDPNQIQSRAPLYDVMSVAYKKLGDESLSNLYAQKSIEANLINGPLSSSQLWNNFFISSVNKNYSFAKSLIPQIKNSPLNIATSDHELLKIYFSIYEELEKFVEEMESTNSSKETYSKFLKKLMPIFEVWLDEGKLKGNKIYLLETLSQMAEFYYFIGDKKISSFYAKQYTNLLQELRSTISNKPIQLQIFTTAYSDKLKNYADIFLDIGDIDSARLTLKIIKENEFIDYLNQRSPGNVLTTKLYIPFNQSEILRKIEVRLLEIEALKNQINNTSIAKNSDSYLNTIKSIQFKNKEISQLREALKKDIYESLKDEVTSTRTSTNILKKDEALIDFYVQTDTLTLIITTSNGSKIFKNLINRPQLRKDLLTFYSNISSPQRIRVNNNLALKISESLLLSQIASLKDHGIKVLKVRTDDLISIIPFAILPIGNSDIGDVFSIKFQGLNDKKVIENPVKTFKAFGVTKAFKEFPALKSVYDEVLYISKISQKSNTKSAYIDADFSKKNLIDAFNSGINTIHIASHYSPVKTLGSSGRLLLGDGSTVSLEDLNFEIHSQSSTSLLTLSACDTGLRTTSDGMSNLEGLSNVFNLKGINNVLGTLWAVSDDSTADFMRLYYLITERNDIDPVTALTLTQKAFKFGDLSTLPSNVNLPNDFFMQSFKQRISKFTHPFYWAAFQLVSN